MNEDTLDSYDELEKLIHEMAVKKVSELKLPKAIFPPADITRLGTKYGNLMEATYHTLFEIHGEKLPLLMAISLHEFWRIGWESSFFMVAHSVADVETGFETAEGYLEKNGWANVFYSDIKRIEIDDLRFSQYGLTPYEQVIEVRCLVACIALYWFYQALIEITRGNVEHALDLLCEANQALICEAAEVYSDLAIKECGPEIVAKSRSELGQQAQQTGYDNRFTPLRKEAIRIFRSQKWKSTRNASKIITPMLLAFCKENNRDFLSEDRAKQTIYEWLLSSLK